MSNKRIARAGSFAAALGLVLAACVDHRPLRNGLRNEAVYVEKQSLTQPNPKIPGTDDTGWLLKVSVVKASAPNALGDFAWPGRQSNDVQYVRFRFLEDEVQLLDARSLQDDDPNDPDDDLSTVTERVVMEFPGTHVDVKFRENLDGERTNWLEENFEEPWQKRQQFKVDFEGVSLEPAAAMAWFFGEYVTQCTTQLGVNLVPDSFELDEDDQYMSFVLEATYALKIASPSGYACYDLLTLSHGAATSTLHYRFSFYRPGPSNYEPQIIAEKDPVNKKFGAFQILNVFRDEQTGLLGAHQLLQRFNPEREEPAVFYFAEGFPPDFKPMFEQIKQETNDLLSDAGAKLRVDFRDFDSGDKVRHFGDIRYSFVAWHQGIDTTDGLLGYGPSAVDPRTGEVISATLNLYNVGTDIYRYYIQTYLEGVGAKQRHQAASERDLDPNTPWEQIPCTTGDTVAPPQGEDFRLQTALFDEMRRLMDIDSTVATYTADDFVPTPSRGHAFFEDYGRLLPELRYADPGSNPYIWRPASAMPLAEYAERMAVEREFQEAMFDIATNNNPFGVVPLYSREGIAAQQAFLDDFRRWRRNHEELEAARDAMRGAQNIYVFDPGDAFHTVSKNARRCVGGHWEADEDYTARIIEGVVAHTAVHEFGHNLSLRHNFYGSVDSLHMHENEVTASVMDYVHPMQDATTSRSWGAYDQAAIKWIYGTAAVRADLMKEDFLYCTDEHRLRSPLCTAHDLGATPSQITLNAIEYYDWMYELRNRRAFRTFWDTSDYVNRVYGSLFPLLRMWYLGIFDWGGGGVQETLMRLDQVDGTRPVLTSQQYDEIAADFYNDAVAAVGMTMAFYDAVINQSASFRNYQTEFDPYYGDILRLGIIVDKLYATFAFMDLQDVYNYDPNVQTYVALYDSPLGTPNWALSQRVLDDMLGSNYDTFPWFKYNALLIFADATNTNLVGSIELRERIAIRRFDSRADFVEVYGQEALEQALRPDNPSQIFLHHGEQHVYTFLPDRAWHLVSGASRNPVSYQFMREYNEDLNARAETSLDSYGLKVLIAYHEYFNNFSGY